ncbi:MAG: PP2C family protein-serine/threonine phosphatase [Clostridium sp.]
MRKLNSKFVTNFISESGTYLQNKDYFAFVELDEYACYVIADGIDEDKELESAKIAVTAFIKRFTEKPSMNQFIIKKYLKEVNDEVVAASRNVRLKSSMTVAVTNYTKLRYYTIGNTRFCFFKDGYLKLKSKDESVTQQMADKELIPLDKMAKHIERNNLTAFLGENKLGEIYVSKKIKLSDKDAFALLTRGIWENCDEKEIEESLEGAKEPKEVIDNVEDIILSRQPKDLQNYTLAVTFVEKAYVNPERKKKIKKAVMIAIPIIIMLVVFLVVMHIKNNKKNDAIADMNNYKVSAENYMDNGNIEKANEDYKNALDIAKKYKLNDKMNEFDDDCKYTDLIIQADQLLNDKKYDEALDKYVSALEESSDLDNIGREYINSKIDIAKNCITVADLLSLADEQLEAGDDKAAEANCLEAKKLALNSYLKDEKKEAMDKLQKIYDDRAKAADDEKAAADKEAADQKAADDEAKKAEEDAKKKEEEDAKKAEEDKKAAQELQSKAIDLRKNGDLNYVSGDYVSAKMYYALAKEAFEEIGSTSLADELEEKIQLMDRKIENVADEKEEADSFLEEANTKYLSGDYNSAKVLYLLSKDIYEKLGLNDDCAKIDEKLKAIG